MPDSDQDVPPSLRGKPSKGDNVPIPAVWLDRFARYEQLSEEGGLARKEHEEQAEVQNGGQARVPAGKHGKRSRTTQPGEHPTTIPAPTRNATPHIPTPSLSVPDAPTLPPQEATLKALVLAMGDRLAALESQVVAPATITLLQANVENLVKANKQKDEEIEHLKHQVECQKDALLQLSSAIKAEHTPRNKRKTALERQDDSHDVQVLMPALQEAWGKNNMKAWDQGLVETTQKRNQNHHTKDKLVVGHVGAQTLLKKPLESTDARLAENEGANLAENAGNTKCAKKAKRTAPSLLRVMAAPPAIPEDQDNRDSFCLLEDDAADAECCDLMEKLNRQK